MKNSRKLTSAICASMVMFNLCGGTNIIPMAYAAEDAAVEETVVPVTAEDLIGTWEGVYSGTNGSTPIDRNYRIEIDNCTEDGKIEGYACVEVGELGEYWFDGTVDYETGAIEFKGIEWYNNPGNLGFAGFSGTVNAEESEISGVIDGKKDRLFSLEKISDTYTERRIDLDSIPLRWNGEYDGHSGDVIVRRNYEIRVQEVAENGTFNGTAFISPSEVEDPEFGVYGSYYIKGKINERTGKIDAKGYEWIERPDDNFSFVDLYGYINAESYCVEGNTEYGIWLMDSVEFKYYDMCGAWVGFYTDISSGENIEKNLRVDIDKCEEDGKIEGIATLDDGKLGKYLFDGSVDFSTGDLSFEGIEWLENPVSMDFEEFNGKLAAKTLTISGVNLDDSNRPFYLRKITDTYESLRIDMDKLPKYWKGEYDGFHNDIVVRRNIDLLITAIDENGDYEGEMTISPSDKADSSYDVNGKFRLKGNISARTGEISFKGYEWIEIQGASENSTYTLPALNGRILPDDFSIDGKSPNGIWIMEPAKMSLAGDANCDGVVTLSDAVAIMQALGNPDKYSLSEMGKTNADVAGNGDGITLNDALAIQKYLAKLIPEL